MKNAPVGRGRPAARLAQTPPREVFVNHTGRRWKRIRAAGLLLLALVVAASTVAAPRIAASPALEGAPVPDGPPRTRSAGRRSWARDRSSASSGC